MKHIWTAEVSLILTSMFFRSDCLAAGGTVVGSSQRAAFAPLGCGETTRI
jgi:hypothetical protein